MWWWVGAIALCLIGWGVASARRILYPEPHPIPVPNPVPPYASYTVTVPDGGAIDVWVLETGAPQGRVLLCHGYYANRYQVLSLAHGLRERGYETVLFELRGHGARPGPCTLGIQESADADAILQWARARDGASALPVGAVGFSMGAAVVCQLARRNPAVRALVADSAYSRFLPVLQRAIWQRYHLPAIPWVWVTWWTLQAMLGQRLAPRDPIALAPQLRIPLLAIQGGEDRRVVPRLGREFFRRWAGPKERWFEPKAAHVGLFARHPTEYCDRVAAFFDRALRV